MSVSPKFKAQWALIIGAFVLAVVVHDFRHFAEFQTDIQSSVAGAAAKVDAFATSPSEATDTKAADEPLCEACLVLAFAGLSIVRENVRAAAIPKSKRDEWLPVGYVLRARPLDLRPEARSRAPPLAA